MQCLVYHYKNNSQGNRAFFSKNRRCRIYKDWRLQFSSLNIEYFKSLLEVDLNAMQQFCSKIRKHWILDRTRSQRYVAVSF